jgi:hypothetical protein
MACRTDDMEAAELWQAAPADAATTPSTRCSSSVAAMPRKEIERVLGSRGHTPGQMSQGQAHESSPRKLLASLSSTALPSHINNIYPPARTRPPLYPAVLSS